MSNPNFLDTYYSRNKEKCKQNVKLYRSKNKDKINAYNRTRYHKDLELSRKIARERARRNPEKYNQRSNNYYHSHKELCRERRKSYYQKNKEREKIKHKEWLKNNPQSGGGIDHEMSAHMNNVRVRDNNSCKWYGCKNNHRTSKIHVHHIYPKKEYPELKLIEKYMICYCFDHHIQWHEARGDKSTVNILRGLKSRI